MQQTVEEITNTIKPGCFVRMNKNSLGVPGKVLEICGVNKRKKEILLVFGANVQCITTNRRLSWLDDTDVDIDLNLYGDQKSYISQFHLVECIIGSLADLNDDHLDDCPCNTCKKYKG